MPEEYWSSSELSLFWASIISYKQEAIRWVIRNQGSFEDGEDVFQNACLLIHLKRQHGLAILKGRERAYVRRMVRLMWWSELRLRRRMRKVLDSFRLQALMVESEITDQEQLEQLQAYLEVLNDTQRNLLLWGALPGVRDEDIAGELGFRSGQVVRQSRYRLMKSLRQHLKAKTRSLVEG